MGLNLAIDLDGTIAEWSADRSVCGEWIVDEDSGISSKEWLHGLIEQGHSVVVHTCRATWVGGGGFKEVARFLRSGDFKPFLVENDDQSVVWRPLKAGDDLPEDAHRIGIWHGRGKPIAHFYIDDRAIPFGGSWREVSATLTEIQAAYDAAAARSE